MEQAHGMKLNVDDTILEFFNEVLDIKVTREDLDAPTQGIVTTVTTAIFKNFGFSDATMSVPEASVSGRSNLDHIQATLPLIHLLKMMQGVYSGLGVNDVGLLDIVQPMPTRTKRLLRLLCQEWKPLSGVWKLYNTIRKQYLQSKAGSKARQDKLDGIKARINQLSRHPGINPERLAAIEQKLAAMTETIETMDERGLSVTSE